MSSGFVTEAEIEEAKRVRQQEWEKVRNPDDPEVAPEPIIDSRSLFDRLQEQKQRKDLEYEETHKLKNMIRGLDDDEVDFLEHVDRVKIEAERKQREEERKILEELKQRTTVAVSNKEQLEAELNGVKNKPKVQITSTKPSQKSLLLGIVRKRSSGEINGDNGTDEKRKKLKTETSEVGESGVKVTAVLPRATPAASNALKCIGILPGIGSYKDTSDSNDSSDAESPTRYDFVGRKLTTITGEGHCQ